MWGDAPHFLHILGETLLFSDKVYCLCTMPVGLQESLSKIKLFNDYVNICSLKKIE